MSLLSPNSFPYRQTMRQIFIGFTFYTPNDCALFYFFITFSSGPFSLEPFFFWWVLEILATKFYIFMNNDLRLFWCGRALSSYFFNSFFSRCLLFIVENMEVLKYQVWNIICITQEKQLPVKWKNHFFERVILHLNTILWPNDAFIVPTCWVISSFFTF